MIKTIHVALHFLSRYNEAIQYFDKALVRQANNILALHNKGLALNELAEYDEAIKYFDKVLAIEPNYRNALYTKGIALDNITSTLS